MATTYTQQTSEFPVAGVNTGLSAQPITTVAIGDLVIVWILLGTAGVTVTGISDSNSLITWNGVITNWAAYEGPMALAWGTVTGTPGNTTVNITFSGSTTSHSNHILVDSWLSSIGASSIWQLAATTTNPTEQDNGASTAITWPSITSGLLAGLYHGYANCDNTPSAGSTTGFGYHVFAGANILTWNGTLAASTAYSPTASQASGHSSAGGAIFAATTAYLPRSARSSFTPISRATNWMRDTTGLLVAKGAREGLIVPALGG